MGRRWPTRDELEDMPTDELSALANALGTGRWIWEEFSREQIIEHLWKKIQAKLN